MNEKIKRSCGDCTECCQGWLHGEAKGHFFYKGKPCHFIDRNGCSIYEDRPENPCKSFFCNWLVDEKIPMWLKPNLSKVIITNRKNEMFTYWKVTEAGSVISSRVLNWLIQHAMANNINLEYFVEGGVNRIGSMDFANFKDTENTEA